MSSPELRQEASENESVVENSQSQTSSLGSESSRTSAMPLLGGSVDDQSSGQSINLTPRALEELKKLKQVEYHRLASKVPQSNIWLRVGVKGGGCSGFSYDMHFVKGGGLRPAEVIENFDGFKVVVDSRSLLYLKGTTIDYTEGLNGQGFVFENPNISGRCGCGSSFSI